MAVEVIPVSIADFYVVAKKNWLNFQKAQSDGIVSGEGRGGFQQARLFLNQGNYDIADKRMGRIKQVPEGEFEYTADLIFAFVDREGNDLKTPAVKTVNNDNGGSSPRQRMITALRESLKFPFNSNNYDYYSQSASKNVRVHELSFLDTANGIATTQHLIQKKTEESGSDLLKVSVLDMLSSIFDISDSCC